MLLSPRKVNDKLGGINLENMMGEEVAQALKKELIRQGLQLGDKVTQAIITRVPMLGHALNIMIRPIFWSLKWALA